MSQPAMAASTAPLEPVLELDDIQGASVPGFLKPHQALIGISCDDSTENVTAFRRFIRNMSSQVATGAATLKDRREHRALKLAGRAEEKNAPTAFVAVALSFNGLLKLTPGTKAIQGDAFRLGLAQRSALLGDPTNSSAEGHPSNWIVGGDRGELDALIIVAGDGAETVKNRAKELADDIEAAHLHIRYSEQGAVRSDKGMKGHEHFGFDDGVSQPGIRGRASGGAGDFITDRFVDPAQTPEAWLYGYPGQTLIWPGEFVIGYPRSSPDPLLPGHVVTPVPEWTWNASFLVFRRLRQDVGLFWRTMRAEAERLSKEKGFPGLTDEHLASLLVGRWPSGAPVNRTPDRDIPDLGKDAMANNYFRFDSDTLPLKLTGKLDKFPMAKADPVGLTCPWSAHIRKVNTRDSASDMGAEDATYTRRLLRVGVPFGKPLLDVYADPKDDPEKGNRGLLFLSVQSSIENHFEFLCSRWVNDPTRPKSPGGHDLIIGQNGAPDENRSRQCVVFGSEYKAATVKTSEQWVIPTGGGYFLLPSIPALRDVLGA
jgi:Dyp-type peroxidase family